MADRPRRPAAARAARTSSSAAALAGAALLLAPAPHAQQPEPASWRSSWPNVAESRWAGPELFANRAQDWRVAAGPRAPARLECLTSSPRLPVRAVHLLTRSAGPADEELRLSVETGAVEEGALPEAAWSGFLLGAGGAQVDYRISALVHCRPAADGGMLAVVDGAGRVALRDFSQGGGGGLWSIGGPLAPEDAPLLGGQARDGEGFGADGPGPLVLGLVARPEDGLWTVELTATRPGADAPLSRAFAHGVAPELVDGSLALVSHLGPEGGAAGFWFRDWRAEGPKLEAHPERAFGPILATQYTLSRGTLKLTAQAAPIAGRMTRRPARLEVRREGDEDWETVATAALVPGALTFPFRVEGWDAARAAEYRVVVGLVRRHTDLGPIAREHEYRGRIRPEPADGALVLAAFTGHKCYTGELAWNEDGIWFPHADLVRAVQAHEPDFLFFSGDQVYEGDLTPAQTAPLAAALLDYHYKFSRWCWAFRDLTRDRPTVTIPDDHDVYHGNVWGAGGRAAVARDGMTAQDAGGYKMPPEFVNAVHATQTSHLPDPFDPQPIEQGITTYHTRVEYAGVSFAVIADRMWKSSPTVACPEGECVNGWFRADGYDAATRSDVPGAELLGERQLRFLDGWAADWSGGAWMKVVLSQTIFADVATLPPPANTDASTPRLPIPAPGEYPAGEFPVADADSNGWPKSARDEALRRLRKGFALHVAGDQHLGSTIRYGVEDWDDAGYALCVPSIANTWPRRWFPSQPGANRAEGAPRYTGEYLDGFGNKMTVLAVSNPSQTGVAPTNLHDRAPGYGIVELDRATRTVELACWPRRVDPTAPGARPYPGWPVRFHQLDARAARAWLPELRFEGAESPVVELYRAADDELVYAIRAEGRRFQPPVFEPDAEHYLVVRHGAERRRLAALEAAATRAAAGRFTVRF